MITRLYMPELFIAGAALSLVSTFFSFAAAREYRLCVGEFDEKCPVSHNVFAGCGANADTVADNTCAIRLQGQLRHIPYRLIHQGSHDGNRCGYEWFSIECLDDVPIAPTGTQAPGANRQ